VPRVAKGETLGDTLEHSRSHSITILHRKSTTTGSGAKVLKSRRDLTDNNK